MDKRSKKFARIYLIAALAAAAVFAVLRVLLLSKLLDFDKEMFTGNSPLPDIFNIALIVVAVLLFSAFFFVKAPSGGSDGSENPYALPLSVPTTFASALSGFMLLACLVIKLLENADNRQMLIQTTGSYGNIQHIFSVLVTVFCVPAAIYFFLTISAVRKKRSIMTLLAVSVILWNAFLIIATYFDISVSFSSPIKLFNQASVICIMAFMLNETRYHVGFRKQKLYLPVAFVSVFLVAVSAIPDIILSMKHDLSVDLIYSALQAAFLLYIISRVLHMLSTEQQTDAAS